jgi:nicotinamide mononucleotide (NMN) deamidase PncC
MKQGRPAKDANLQVSRESAAKMLKVSERTVASAAKVQEQGIPELVQAVEAGKVSVSAAGLTGTEGSQRLAPDQR